MHHLKDLKYSARGYANASPCVIGHEYYPCVIVHEYYPCVIVHDYYPDTLAALLQCDLHGDTG